MKFFATMIASLGLLFASAAFAGGDEWMTDYAEAQKLAKEEGKALLLDFTGSDWCGWCIKLKEEVFSQDGWADEAQKHFVLVELDYPRDQSLVTDEERAQNERLKNLYGAWVRGYPTILLTTAEGDVINKTGYQRGGPEKYNSHLAELLENREAAEEKANEAAQAVSAISEAESSEAKKTALQDAISFFDSAEATHPGAWRKWSIIDTVIEVDPKNKEGMLEVLLDGELVNDALASAIAAADPKNKDGLITKAVDAGASNDDIYAVVKEIDSDNKDGLLEAAIDSAIGGLTMANAAAWLPKADDLKAAKHHHDMNVVVQVYLVAANINGQVTKDFKAAYEWIDAAKALDVGDDEDAANMQKQADSIKARIEQIEKQEASKKEAGNSKK